MSAMSLEAEKNELIRRILDVDDVAILRRVKSMLSCEEEQTNVVAEEAAPYQTKAEILDSFIKQYYAGTPFIPGELMLQEELEEQALLEEWLSTKRGQKVTIRIPKKGTKEKLVELAQKNAQRRRPYNLCSERNCRPAWNGTDRENGGL